MDQHTKEKIYTLFYTDNPQNRALAFELAKGMDYYEELIEELYAEFCAFPTFEVHQGYLLEDLEAEGEPIPTGIARKQLFIEDFAAYLFYPDINLSKRSIYGNDDLKLKTFPLVLTKLSFVKKLNLGWNDIDAIPPEIVNMSSLEELDLSCNNQLRGVPDNFGELKKLRKLSVYGISGFFAKRKFKYEDPDRDDYSYEFPDCFRHLTQLVSFDLGDVIIERLPTWIHEWTNLEAIWIFSGFGSHPYLELPPSFVQLSKLKTFQVNAYTVDIPDNIHLLESLETLVVEPARKIPSSIKQLKNLKYLDFSYLSYDYSLPYEGYDALWDIDDKGIPEGISRIQLYGWDWLKEMIWLEEFTFKHIEPYAFTELEEQEFLEALPNCNLVLGT